MSESGAANDGNVDVGAIANAPAEMPPLEAPKKNENPLTGQLDPNLDRHLGVIGKFVGGGPEKAGNIAALVIIGSLLGLIGAAIGLALSPASSVEVFKLLIGGCFSLITGALGFIFGASTKENGH